MDGSESLPKPLDPAVAGQVVDANVAMLGLAIEPVWREAAIANLVGIAGAARFVEAFPLEDELEPAPVFRA